MNRNAVLPNHLDQTLDRSSIPPAKRTHEFASSDASLPRDRVPESTTRSPSC